VKSPALSFQKEKRPTKLTRKNYGNRNSLLTLGA